MTVTLTSEAVGKKPGEPFTGTAEEESWLLAQGYATRDGYVGPGVSDTGVTDVTPDADLTLAENREAPTDPAEAEDPFAGSQNDYDYDKGGVDIDPPELAAIEPDTGPAAGGTVVTITGDNLTGVTGVTFGGVAGTAVAVEDDNTVTVTTPAGAAGTVDVVVTDPNGADTAVGGFTYTA